MRRSARHTPRCIFHSVMRTSSGSVMYTSRRDANTAGSSSRYQSSRPGSCATPCRRMTSEYWSSADCQSAVSLACQSGAAVALMRPPAAPGLRSRSSRRSSRRSSSRSSRRGRAPLRLRTIRIDGRQAQSCQLLVDVHQVRRPDLRQPGGAIFLQLVCD